MVVQIDEEAAAVADIVADLFDLDIPTELTRLREAYRTFFLPHVRHAGISHQYWRVMQVLARRGPSEVTQISRAAAVPPASLSRLLPRMEDEGFIRRTWRANDKRRIVVELTAHGRARHAHRAEIVRRALADLAGALDADTLLRLGRLLRRANEEMEKAIAAQRPR